MPSAGVSTGSPSVPESTSVRPSWPSLKITEASAPAFCGVDDLLEEGAGAALHQRDLAADVDAVEVGGLAAAGRARLGARRQGQVNGDQSAVTSPLPEYSIVAKSAPSANDWGSGEVRASTDGASWLKLTKSNGWRSTFHP